MAYAPPETLPNDIRLAREALGLSQRALASKLHVTQTTVMNWELGRWNLRKRRQVIAHLLGLDPTSLRLIHPPTIAPDGEREVS